MTKSRESGENEITDEAKREASRTKQDPSIILAAWFAEAKAAGDGRRASKIVRAQKYLGYRNIQKRKPKQ